MNWIIGLLDYLRLVILAQCASVVGERSECSEVEPEGLVERLEVRMPV